MAKLVWDDTGDRLYEVGVRHGVLYVMKSDGTYDNGVAWNGLTAVTESPSGAEATKLWADDINYLTMYSAEEFGMTIEAYTYPEEFYECDGTANLLTGGGLYLGQQARKTFGFCYRTEVGNDVSGEEYGYKLHIAYGCKASPSEKAYSTINDSPEAITFSWEVTTTPINVNIPNTDYKPTSIITIDSTKFTGNNAEYLTTLEGILYGTDGQSGTSARLPLPAEVYSILSTGSYTPG